MPGSLFSPKPFLKLWSHPNLSSRQQNPPAVSLPKVHRSYRHPVNRGTLRIPRTDTRPTSKDTIVTTVRIVARHRNILGPTQETMIRRVAKLCVTKLIARVMMFFLLRQTISKHVPSFLGLIALLRGSGISIVLRTTTCFLR